MKRLVSAFGVLSLIWAFAGPVSASLIGDTVVVGYAQPYYWSPPLISQQVTVESGAGDLVTVGSFQIDIEDTSLTVNSSTTEFFLNKSFNGLVIREIDDYLTGVQVNTDISGWDESRIIFGEDFAAFNLAGLSFTNNTEFNAMFEFGPNPIPIPTTAVLFVTGLIGFALVRRKKTED